MLKRHKATQSRCRPHQGEQTRNETVGTKLCARQFREWCSRDSDGKSDCLIQLTVITEHLRLRYEIFCGILLRRTYEGAEPCPSVGAGTQIIGGTVKEPVQKTAFNAAMARRSDLRMREIIEGRALSRPADSLQVEGKLDGSPDATSQRE
jgi:hypothetical protein